MNINNSSPLQKVSWAKKVKDDYQWFKDNIDFRISESLFGEGPVGQNRITKIKTLFEIYNSKFPSSWTNHITNPFSGTDEKRVWPAKIRPMNIIRPNVEYLRGEYMKRPFNYTVVMKGEDGYKSFVEARQKTLYKNLSQIFINTVNEESQKLAEQEGVAIDTGVDSRPTEMPEDIINKFIGSYKNQLAAQAQTDLELILEDQKIREKLTEQFKHYLITGECYSFKDVLRDETVYRTVDPAYFDTETGPKYVKDGDANVELIPMTVSDVVDRFYDSLKSKEIDQLEDRSYSASPSSFANYLNERFDNKKVPVYFVTWRSMEKVGFLSYPNPITGKPESDIVNETYKANPELGETIEWYWRTRWMGGYRIDDLLYAEMKPIRFSPSMINDLGKTIGPYNGIRFSDTHADNISVVKLLMPFQIIYMIAAFAKERTLAKSRGKIILIDQNVIPKGAGWTDEKFFHLAEAQGWALINRNQVGVDKSFNQYNVLDLSLFDHLDKLDSIMDNIEAQAERQIGLSRPLKGQGVEKSSTGSAEAAIYQSSIITDMIFVQFEDYVKTEMEGLLDASQISNIHGKRSSYVSSEGRTELLNMNAEEYPYSQMGIMVSNTTQDNDALRRIRSYMQALVQNGMPASAVFEMETSNNIAQLKALSLQIERDQAEQEQKLAESEQEARLAEIELQQQFAEYNALLDTQRMHEEYNRKEDLVLIQGDINMALEAASNGQEADAGVQGTEALLKYTNESNKIAAESDRKNKELAAKVQTLKNKEKQETRLNNHKMKMAEKDHQLKKEISNKQLQIKKQQAKKAASTKK